MTCQPHLGAVLIVSCLQASSLQAQSRLPDIVKPKPAIVDIRIGGSVNPAFDLLQVRDIETDLQGNIFVLDAADQQVKMFDRTGRSIKIFGRKGPGPGEFTGASKISVFRDSLFVIDRQNDRVTAFSLGTTGLHAVVIPGTGVGRKRVEEVVSGGVLSSVSTVSSFNGVSNNRFNLVMLNSQGTTMRTILSGLPTPVSLTYTATARSNPSNTYRGFTKQPFAHYHMWDVGETGTSVVQAFTVSRAGQETDRFRIIKVHMRGDTIWDRQLLYPARPLRNSDIKAWIDSVSGTTVKLKAATLVPNRKMLEDSLKRPKYWPPVVGIVHGIDGTIWLQQNAYGGGGLRYWMLSARGEYQATIEFPAGLRLLEASRTHAWGWMADADGLPEIVRYRVPQ